MAGLEVVVFSVDALFHKRTYLWYEDLVECYSSHKPSFLIFSHTKMAWPEGIMLHISQGITKFPKDGSFSIIYCHAGWREGILPDYFPSNFKCKLLIKLFRDELFKQSVI